MAASQKWRVSLWSISFTPHLMFESFPHHTLIQSKLECLEKQELVLPEDTNPAFCHSRLVEVLCEPEVGTGPWSFHWWILTLVSTTLIFKL